MDPGKHSVCECLNVEHNWWEAVNTELSIMFSCRVIDSLMNKNYLKLLYFGSSHAKKRLILVFFLKSLLGPFVAPGHK